MLYDGLTTGLLRENQPLY